MNKYISYDYDGTLWEENGTDAPIVQVNQIKEYNEKQGYKSIIVTSRAPEYLQEIKDNYPDTPVYSSYEYGNKAKFIEAFDGEIVRHYDNNPEEIIDIALSPACKGVETVFVAERGEETPYLATRRIIIFRD